MTEFTGERVIPGQVEADLWAEHLSRYRFAANVAAGLGSRPSVLDVGCGTGYGTAALAESASSAIGIDLAGDAIAYARSHYRVPSLRFLAGSATALPFADASFDLITAFEVIEHLEDSSQLLMEARRVLRPGGALLVSTPNTTYYAETRAERGPNPYHVHEFEFDEFLAAVATVFPCCAILLQNHTDAFAFYDPAGSLPMDGYFETTSGAPTDAHFFLAVCSFEPLTSLRNFIYVPAATNLLREREHHIGLLKQEIATARDERDTMIRANDEQKHQFVAAARHIENQTRQLQALYDDLQQKIVDLKTVVDALDEAEKTVVERTLWAQRLDTEVTYCRELLHHIDASRWLKLGRKFGVGPKFDASKDQR